MPAFSDFARTVTVEGAFGVLAVAKQLKARGKRVIELEIGDSPFPSTPAAKQAGLAAIQADQSHYCASVGLPEFRQAAAEFVNAEYGLEVAAANIVVGPGAKIFETLFCQAFLNPGDARAGLQPALPHVSAEYHQPGRLALAGPPAAGARFPAGPGPGGTVPQQRPLPTAIFLNSPHNPTGGVATEDDLRNLADLVRGRNVAVLSDEPYSEMVWRGRHHSLLAQPGMLDQCVAAYTFSKSYSMSGWRLGFSVASTETAEMLGKLVNISVSCVPPIVQLAGIAAMRQDAAARDQMMRAFREKVEILYRGLNEIPGFKCLDPAGAFYVFPSVAEVCQRLDITSEGLAMYFLEGADDQLGVACLGGECFGEAGEGFIRFSCAEPNDQLRAAIDFVASAVRREDRVQHYLDAHPQYRSSARD